MAQKKEIGRNVDKKNQNDIILISAMVLTWKWEVVG